jgi:RND family efflux transporter MFP subunit
MESKSSSDSGFILFVKYLLPFILLGILVVIVWAMYQFRAAPSIVEVTPAIPTVDVLEVHSGPVSLNVQSNGLVEPRVSTMLVSEVSGIVEWVSPSLYSGGFFKEGDLLLKIEPSDYIAQLANAKRLLAQMELLYQQELALAAQAREDWEQVGEGEPTDLVLRIPQINKAKADIEYAKASLVTAERNLSYTEVKAPYDGRVRAKFVDVGQSVATKTSQLASIYSIDVAEIVVSLSLTEAEFINLPELFADQSFDGAKPEVSVFMESATGRRVSWTGVVDRTDGVVDSSTRMIRAIVRVEDPYARDNEAPLKVGMFVSVEIAGKTLESAFRLPRKALRPGDIIHVLTEDDELKIAEVDVVKKDVESVVIVEGLNDGDRIILTPLQQAVDGMKLKVESEATLESEA